MHNIMYVAVIFTSLHFTSLHFTSLHFTSLHSTSLHFTSLHYLTSLHFTSLGLYILVSAFHTQATPKVLNWVAASLTRTWSETLTFLVNQILICYGNLLIFELCHIPREYLLVVHMFEGMPYILVTWRQHKLTEWCTVTPTTAVTHSLD
jgi:hypothetical protein